MAQRVHQGHRQQGCLCTRALLARNELMFCIRINCLRGSLLTVGMTPGDMILARSHSAVPSCAGEHNNIPSVAYARARVRLSERVRGMVHAVGRITASARGYVCAYARVHTHKRVHKYACKHLPAHPPTPLRTHTCLPITKQTRTLSPIVAFACRPFPRPHAGSQGVDIPCEARVPYAHTG